MSDCDADRISVYEADPGYPQYAALGDHEAKIKVLLDGVEQRACVTADRTQGWVRRFKDDAEGWPIIVGDHFVTEVVYGVVEFKIEENAA